MAEQPDDQIHGLVRVARMYYEQNMPQEEIARVMDRSRPTISRMLAAARGRGIVHIDIRVPLDRSLMLEQALVDRFGLTDVQVVIAASAEVDSVDHLGRATAGLLQQLLEDGMTVGVSSGRTLASTAKYLEPIRSLHLQVVQIIGAMGDDNPEIDGPDIARAMAAAYNTRCRYLHVPLLVDDVQTRNLLLRDRSIAQTIQMGAASDVALVGVGTLDPRDRSPITNGYLSAKDVTAITSAGGIGHICGEHYNVQGQRLKIAVNDRTVGIGLGALAKIPRVIAIAGGQVKAPAIVAAIRGGYVDTLITDDRAAGRMLALAAGSDWPRTQRRKASRRG